MVSNVVATGESSADINYSLNESTNIHYTNFIMTVL